MALAEADGFVRDPTDTCEVPAHLGLPAAGGAMGIHYLHPGRLGVGDGDTRLDVTGIHTDFLRPAILVYEPQEDGSLDLVAVENVVSARAWEAAGNTAPPSFHGVEYTFAPDDPERTLRAHYDLHLWVFRENPEGISAPYNPAVSCRHHERHMPMDHPMGDADPRGHIHR